MIWSLGIFLLAWVGSASSIFADEKTPAKSEGLEGRKATDAELESMKDGGWVFKGFEVTFDDPRAPGKSSFKVDPGKSPKTIDLVALDGPQKGKTMEGIYKLEDKRLTICVRDLASAAKGRPTEFATKAESGLGLIVLERADR